MLKRIPFYIEPWTHVRLAKLDGILDLLHDRLSNYFQTYLQSATIDVRTRLGQYKMHGLLGHYCMKFQINIFDDVQENHYVVEYQLRQGDRWMSNRIWHHVQSHLFAPETLATIATSPPWADEPCTLQDAQQCIDHILPHFLTRRNDTEEAVDVQWQLHGLYLSAELGQQGRQLMAGMIAFLPCYCQLLKVLVDCNLRLQQRILLTFMAQFDKAIFWRTIYQSPSASIFWKTVHACNLSHLYHCDKVAV
jgi:hypothetical protein